jgi:hypothetical protein
MDEGSRRSEVDQADEPHLPGALANQLPLQTQNTRALSVSIQLIGPIAPRILRPIDGT